MIGSKDPLKLMSLEGGDEENTSILPDPAPLPKQFSFNELGEVSGGG